MRIPATLCVAFLVGALQSPACEVMYPSIETGPDFHVQVQSPGPSVTGLKLVLLGDRQFTAIADQKGVARFHDIPSGHYHLGPSLDAGIPDGAEIHVRSTNKSGIVISLRWPATSFVRTSALKGLLRRPEYRANAVQPEIPLELLDGISGKVLAASGVSPRGEFNFPVSRTGFYLLRIRSEGLIGVMLDPNSGNAPLDLLISQSSCGLDFTDLSKCRPPNLVLQRLLGQLVDPVLAHVPRGTITLADNAGTVVEQLQSDANGHFDSSAILPAGSYELTATSPGFTPFREIIRVQPSAAPPVPLTIRLGIMGACSTAYW